MPSAPGGSRQSKRNHTKSQAQAAKERYNADLADYKKTPEYREEYSEYLQEFKAKYSHQALGMYHAFQDQPPLFPPHHPIGSSLRPQ